MRLNFTVKTAYRALLRNKSRSFLTILGIVIGVMAIILISSLGQGAQNLILAQIQGLGSRTIEVNPGREPSGPSDFGQMFTDSLKERDLRAIENKSRVPTASQIIPLVFGGGTGSYRNETYGITIYGVSEGIQSVFNLSVEEGNFWTDDDVRAKASVAVIGSKVKEELFDGDEAVGQRIRIRNHSFRVVGVLPDKGQVSLFNFDKVAMIPYTTAQDYVFGINYFNEFIVEADSEENIERTVQDLTYTLREMHGIDDPEKDDFYIQTQAELANSLGTVTDVLTVFLASVAGISLFVAGIGIMNIMLVSVTERTREIGLRKALGATEKNILQQFLLEAVMLTATGGIIGVSLGVGFSLLISTILSSTLALDWTFTFPLGATIIGILVSAVVGLVFGLYPARQAARKSPIEALRYE